MRPGLERLEATTLSYEQDYILYNLQEFPQMTDLRLTYTDDGQALEIASFPEAEACTLHLKTLEIGAVLRPDAFAHLTDSSRDSLERISLYVRRSAHDLSSFSRLKEVALHGIEGHWKAVGDVVATLPPTVTYLEVCPSDDVTNLDESYRRPRGLWDLRGSERAENKRDRVRQRTHPDEYSFPTSLSRLPPQLTRLAFMLCIEDTNSDALIAALRDRTWLPDLKQFETADALWMNGEASDDENEDGMDPDDLLPHSGFASESLIRTRAEKRALVEACAARGIRLGPRKQHWEDARHGLELVPRVFIRPPCFDDDEDDDGEENEGSAIDADEWEDYMGESGSEGSRVGEPEDPSHV